MDVRCVGMGGDDLWGGNFRMEEKRENGEDTGKISKVGNRGELKNAKIRVKGEIVEK